jgi:ligand-binding sensor domain-containing protein
MKRKLFVLLLLVLPAMMYAIHPVVRNFTRKDYKSGTQNWAVTQDNDNIMYFANNNGMLIFDGKNWTTVPIKNGTNVRSLVFDGKNRFYASTFNEFGYFRRSSSGSVEYYSLSDSLDVKSSSSNELYKYHTDRNLVYFQGERTVYRYDGKKNSTFISE